MKFHILTIFPDFFRGPFDHGVVPKAREAGKIDILIHDLRTWTYDRHRTVDDRPFGGAEGMLLKPQPIFEAVEAIWPDRATSATEPRMSMSGHNVEAVETTGPERAPAIPATEPRVKVNQEKPGGRDITPGVSQGISASPKSTSNRKKIILLSAQGRKYDQSLAREFSTCDELLLICGRYEGVDERVALHLADEEISIGDYVLSGGELAAAIVVDSVARLIEGVLGNETSIVDESFSREGLLDWPQYTRPADFRGWKVPDVLIGGNHAEIRKWRERAAREKTERLRPDLLKAAERPKES